jgi:glucan-binding YG repeat protein
MKRQIIIPALTVCFTLSVAITAYAGQWKQEEGQWYYEQDGANLCNGWEKLTESGIILRIPA